MRPGVFLGGPRQDALKLAEKKLEFFSDLLTVTNALGYAV
jgi:hypothetical protein